MNGESVQRTILLTDEQAQDWPVRTETMWFRDLGQGSYAVKNTPLFLDNLAVDDVVQLRCVGDGEWQIEKVLLRSGNETIWVLVREDDFGEKILDQAVDLGCQIDGGVLAGQFALNLGPIAKKREVLELLQRAEKLKLLDLAFPMAD